MSLLPKFAQFPLWLLLACLAAGLYGMAHNQITYTLGPEYFTAFKFRQFHVGPDFPPRLAAAIIGWKASWWMGIIAGLPVFALALFVPGRAGYARLCSRGFALVLASAFVIALVAFLFGLMLREAWLPDLSGLNLADPPGFARAALMHDASYLGAFTGLALALGFVSVQLWRVRNRAGS
jgi:hypothetical protein